MTEYMYRFRTTKYLLDDPYKELENREIYFAARDELNDPMEGAKDICWKGDKILWKNLLRHYLLCLEHVCQMDYVCGNELKLNAAHIPVFKTAKNLETQKYAELYEEICQAFLNDSDIAELLSQLSARQSSIRQHELICYLQLIHPRALHTVFATYERHNLKPPRSLDDPLQQLASKPIEWGRFVNLDAQSSQIANNPELFFQIITRMQEQLNLGQRYNQSLTGNLARENQWFLISGFSQQYVRQLEKLLYPEWYVAAFSARCDDPAMWGLYANGHQGVCLKFRTSMTLHGIIGWGGSKQKSGPIYGNQPHSFHPVTYTDTFVEIDFFRSLGRLPVPTLNGSWYCDKDGNKSSCFDSIYADQDQWRTKYWDADQRIKTIKTTAWAREEEYRLTLSGLALDFSEKSTRKSKYSHDALDGLIFGMNTSESDKLKIINVIDKTYPQDKKKDFKFYQAYYSSTEGKMAIAALNLLALKA